MLFDDCLLCPAGTYGLYAAEKRPLCSGLCPLGTYSPLTGLKDPANCNWCAVGRYGDEAGQSSGTQGCKECQAGRANPKLRSTAVLACEICGSGKYQSIRGSASCELCPTGTYSKLAGQTAKAACALCDKGSFSTAMGQRECGICPIGRYNDREGSSLFSDCAICPKGTFGNTSGATTSTCSGLCLPGTFSKDGMKECKICCLVPSSFHLILVTVYIYRGRGGARNLAHTLHV